MKKVLLAVFAAPIAMCSLPAWSACTTTINPGADLAAAINASHGGDTLCLNSGSYYTPGTPEELAFAQPQPPLSGSDTYVHVQSTSGQGAHIAVHLWRSHNIDITSVVLDGYVAVACSSNLRVRNSSLTDGMFIDGSNDYDAFSGYCTGSPGATYTVNALIDSNTIEGDRYGGGAEGRVQLRNGAGYTVTNNTFPQTVVTGSVHKNRADGVQLAGTQTVVLHDNVFVGPIQSLCDTNNSGVLVPNSGPHCDPIQLLGTSGVEIHHNWLHDGSTLITAVDGSSNTNVHDNIFDHYVGSSPADPALQFGGSMNLTFNHNTVFGAYLQINVDHAGDPSSGAILTNNIFDNGTASLVQCTSCSVDHNLFRNASDVVGTNYIQGAPTYKSGNAHPLTPANTLLKATSLGHNAATDGKDMGVNP